MGVEVQRHGSCPRLQSLYVVKPEASTPGPPTCHLHSGFFPKLCRHMGWSISLSSSPKHAPSINLHQPRPSRPSSSYASSLWPSPAQPIHPGFPHLAQGNSEFGQAAATLLLPSSRETRRPRLSPWPWAVFSGG